MIAKIERTAEAIPQLEAILKASDGIMVARGDLAVEVGNAAVPALPEEDDPHGARDGQGRHHRHADDGVDDQNPVPTRAEVSDVANAVLDGTDAVMLSAETAAGKYPVETVRADGGDRRGGRGGRGSPASKADMGSRTVGRIDQSIAMGALFTAHHLGCKAILALTESGSTALWMSRHRIDVPIYALTTQSLSERKMALYRNVRPILMPKFEDRDTALAAAEQLAGRARRAASGRHLRDHLRRTDGVPGWNQHAEGLPRRLRPGLARGLRAGDVTRRGGV